MSTKEDKLLKLKARRQKLQEKSFWLSCQIYDIETDIALEQEKQRNLENKFKEQKRHGIPEQKQKEHSQNA